MDVINLMIMPYKTKYSNNDELNKNIVDHRRSFFHFECCCELSKAVEDNGIFKN